jgi:hypothetical protein
MAALSVTAASVVKTSTGLYNQGVAGASITAGQPLYIDTANNYVLKPSNADSLGSALAASIAGFSICAATTGQLVQYAIADSAYKHGLDTAVVAAGDVIYVDDTAGGLTRTYADLDVGDFVNIALLINADETTAQIIPSKFTPVVKA